MFGTSIAPSAACDAYRTAARTRPRRRRRAVARRSAGARARNESASAMWIHVSRCGSLARYWPPVGRLAAHPLVNGSHPVHHGLRVVRRAKRGEREEGRRAREPSPWITAIARSARRHQPSRAGGATAAAARGGRQRTRTRRRARGESRCRAGTSAALGCRARAARASIAVGARDACEERVTESQRACARGVRR